MPKKKKKGADEEEKPAELAESLAVWNEEELDGVLANGGEGYSAEAAELLLPEALRERVGPRTRTPFALQRLGPCSSSSCWPCCACCACWPCWPCCACRLLSSCSSFSSSASFCVESSPMTSRAMGFMLLLFLLLLPRAAAAAAVARLV
jgi:hypothetical protein